MPSSSARAARSLPTGRPGAPRPRHPALPRSLRPRPHTRCPATCPRFSLLPRVPWVPPSPRPGPPLASRAPRRGPAGRRGCRRCPRGSGGRPKSRGRPGAPRRGLPPLSRGQTTCPGFKSRPRPSPRPRPGTYPSRCLPGEVHGVDADGDGGHPLLGFPEVVGEGGHLPLGHDQNILLEACGRQRGAMGGSPAGPGRAPLRARAPAAAAGGGGARPRLPMRTRACRASIHM